MGTTVTAAVIMNETAIFAQIGDSRGYIIRKGKIIRATKDQSLVSQLIEAGHLSEEEAQTFEHSNIILQAVGTQEEITIDITYTELKQDDIMVLCTDGLYIHLNDEKIKELAEKFEPEEACRSLTRLANEKGGQDNITVIVAQFKGKGLSLPDEKETVEIKRYKHLRIPPESPTEESPPQKIKEEKREIKAKSKLKIPVTIGTIISLFILFLYLGTHYIKNITESRVVTFPPPKQSHSLKVKKDIPKDFKSQIKQKQKIKKDKSTILDFQPLPPPKEKKKIAPKTIPLRKKPKPLTQKKILKPQKPKVKEPTESKKEPSFPGPLPRPNPY
jgi:serine/threonine protein phosphatase PrpC